MGEIAEALRRANAERAQEREEKTVSPLDIDEAEENSQERVYTQSQELYHSLQSEEETVAAPTPDASGAPGSAVVELKHRRRESVPPQGVVVDNGGAITESCFQLAMRVRNVLEDRSARSLLVVSALRNEGKTTVACNLALALATLSPGRQVALVDLDLRRPSVARVLELEETPVGVEAVISGEAPIGRARCSISKPALDVYPAIQPQSYAHELLILPGLDALVRELEHRYDAVVFDSPPSLLVPDAALILEHVSMSIPVARAGVTRERSFRRMLAMLPGRQMLGAIMNDASPLVRKSDYGYYRSQSGDAVD